MRRTLTVLALVLTLAGLTSPAYAAPTGHGSARHWTHHHPHPTSTAPLVIHRWAAPLRQVAPGVEAEPTFPEVTVRARLRGCEPGRLYLVHARFFQHHREITGVSGGRGFEEFGCDADGTALISQSRFDPDGRLHPGWLRVRFEVLTWEQDVVVASAAARVRIPRR